MTVWDNCLGHAPQIAQLRGVLAQRALAASYLFSGPAGIGKFRVAIALAQSLHCPKACGVCSTCARIAAGTHPDVHLLAPEKNDLRIDQVRTMQTRVQFHPLEGPAKVVVIDRAEALHPAAANACLKILEEPPPATHFFLISAQPHRLLPTIRSRCQTIAFQPLPTALLRRELLHQRAMSGEHAEAIAVMAEGSLGFALQCPPELVTDTAADLTTVVGHTATPSLLVIAERWASDADQLPVHLHVLALCARAALAQRLGARACIPPSCAPVVDQMAHHSASRLTRQLTAILQCVHDVAATTFNKQLLCEALLFSLHDS